MMPRAPAIMLCHTASADLSWRDRRPIRFRERVADLHKSPYGLTPAINRIKRSQAVNRVAIVGRAMTLSRCQIASDPEQQPALPLRTNAIVGEPIGIG